jgi:branched-chain amino acid transport system permease protein
MKKHAVLLLALAVVLAMPLFMRSGSLASEVLIFALAAMACNLLLGYAGLLSFGQGIFFGLGSYTIALLLTRWPVPMPLALLSAAAIGALSAVVVGWIAIRQRGVYFVMLTLGLAQMVYFAAYSMPGLTGGDNGLLDVPRPAIAVIGRTLWPLETPWQYYGFVAAIFLLVFWLMQRTAHSIFGRTLLAVRDNPERAAAVG